MASGGLGSHFRYGRNFVVEAKTTGRELGTGSYGTVEEIEVNGMLCAGKKIHEILLDAGNIGVQSIISKYVQECQIMSDLRHPNIALFIGICFFPGSKVPILVMERLEESLDDLLETVPNIPFTLKLSILMDVARGLSYLHKHEPVIIHRDLTAKNVLLTSSLVAKITDLGNSRIVNIQPGQLAQTMSRNPGTLVYMPPEALFSGSRYGPSLDVFSFGQLSLFVGLQVFPGDILEPTYIDMSDSRLILARSEVERRQHYIEQLSKTLLKGEKHPLIQLIKRCLHNDPRERPTATSEHLISCLDKIKAVVDGPYENVDKADAVRKVIMLKALFKRDKQVSVMNDELAAKDKEIHHLQQELEYEQAERARVENQLEEESTALPQTDMLIDQKEAKIKDLEQVNNHLQQEIADIQLKDGELKMLHASLEEKEAQLIMQDEEINVKEAEISRLIKELKNCHSKLEELQGSHCVSKSSSSAMTKMAEVRTCFLDKNIDMFRQEAQQFRESVCTFSRIGIKEALCYLRASRFDCLKAIEVFKNYTRHYISYKLDQLNPYCNPLSREVASKKLEIVGSCDSDGSPVAIFTVARHDKQNSGHMESMQLLFYKLDQLAESESENGIVIIMDMRDISIESFDVRYFIHMLSVVFSGYPIFTKAVFIIDMPLWVKTHDAIVKQLNEAKNEIHFVSMNELYDKHFRSNQLPPSLGGSYLHSS